MAKSAAALIVAPWDVVVFHSVMPRYSPILALVLAEDGLKWCKKIKVY